MNLDINNILLGFVIGIIATSTFFLMIGEVETEIRLGSSSDNEKVAILFTNKNEIEIIDLDNVENITINVQEDKFDFKITSNDGSEIEELLRGKTLQFKYPPELIDEEEIELKLLVIN